METAGVVRASCQVVQLFHAANLISPSLQKRRKLSAAANAERKRKIRNMHRY